MQEQQMNCLLSWSIHSSDRYNRDIKLLKMTVLDFLNVTPASADSALLLCWVKRARLGGGVLSLLLKHRKITTILQCTSLKRPEAKTTITYLVAPAEVQKKRSSKKRLETLISYQQAWWRRRGYHPVGWCCSMLLLHHPRSSSLMLLWKNQVISMFK